MTLVGVLLQRKTVPGLPKLQQHYDEVVNRSTQTDPKVIATVYSAEEMREELCAVDKNMTFPDNRTLTGAKKALVAQMAQRLSEIRTKAQ